MRTAPRRASQLVITSCTGVSTGLIPLATRPAGDIAICDHADHLTPSITGVSPQSCSSIIFAATKSFVPGAQHAVSKAAPRE